MKFDHKAEPWLDLENIKKYPIGILQMEWTTGVPTKKVRTRPSQGRRGNKLRSKNSDQSPGHRMHSENTDQSLPPLHTRLSQISQSDRIRQGTSDAEIQLPQPQDFYTPRESAKASWKLSWYKSWSQKSGCQQLTVAQTSTKTYSLNSLRCSTTTTQW